MPDTTTKAKASRALRNTVLMLLAILAAGALLLYVLLNLLGLTLAITATVFVMLLVAIPVARLLRQHGGK